MTARVVPVLSTAGRYVKRLAVAFSRDGLSGAVAEVRASLEPLTGWMTRNKPIVLGIAAAVGVVLVAAFVSWAIAAGSAAIATIAAAAPVIALGVAVAALVAGVVCAYENVGFFRTAVDALKTALQVSFEWIRTNVPQIIGRVVDAFGPLFTVFAKVVSAYIGVWTKLVQIGGYIVEFFTGLPARVRRGVSGMFDGLKDAFKTAINWVIDKWNGLGFTLPDMGIDIPWDGRGPYKFGGQTFRVKPQIPGLSAGGTVTASGAVLVGERGPEMLQLPRAAQVTPLSRQGGTRSGPGTSIVINMASGSDGADVVEALQRYARAHGGTIPIVTGQL